jgi:peptidoglycan/LPS O-acetylase OafA/YrhL
MLRFIAFFPIFLAHMVPLEIDSYHGHHLSAVGARMVITAAYSGLVGLNTFFVLSAFLITTLLLRERDLSGTVNLKDFYVRRVLRIWPLYFFAIGIGVFWRYVDFSAHLEHRYAIPFLLLIGNWPFVFYGSTASFMAPLWSVSVEEQFYLVWPLLLRRMTKHGMVLFSIGLVAVGGLGVWSLTAHGYPMPEKSTFAQLPSIAVGIVLACIPPFRLSTAHRILYFFAGLIVVFASSWVYKFSGLNYTIVPLLGAAGAGLVFISIVWSSLNNRLMCYFGKIGYGLYVYHVFCLYVVKKLLFRHANIVGSMYLEWGFAAIVLTLATSALSYHVLEAPFLRLKDRFAIVHSRPV